HSTVDCASCHTSGYTGTPQECISCHQDKYNEAPEHSAQNYPTTCELCHSTNTWEETDFDHNNTNFPLTGSHSSFNG
ncbi:MAG: hypothetical protein GXO87_10330, partial [Chlorobi bacterium]|nr:hypothetical protein [Chlorobiota bacterium]